MPANVKSMLESANAAVPRIDPAQARDMIAKGSVLVIDVRDAPEIQQSGKIAGAINVSRGMLEFRADPDSPYHELRTSAIADPVLRIGRTLRAWRQDPQGYGLRARLQPRRAEGLDRGRRTGRERGIARSG